MQNPNRIYIGLPIVASMLLAACASDVSDGDESSGGRLDGVTWGDFWQTGTQEIYCGELEKSIGTECRLTSGTSTDMVSQAIAQSANPQWDFIYVDDAYVASLVANDAIEEIDFSRIPNTADYFTKISNQAESFDHRYVPVWTQRVGIAYRADLLAEAGLPEPTSWNDLWDPIYEGKVVLPDWTLNFGYPLLEVAAKVRCGDVKDLECGFQEVVKLRTSGQIASVAASGTALEEAFAGGSAMVGVSNDGRIYGLADKGVDVKYIDPSEFPLIATAGIVATRDTNMIKLVELFNIMTDPHTSAQFLSEVPYGPVSERTARYLGADSNERLVSTEAEFNRFNLVDWNLLSPDRVTYVKKFTRQVAS